MFSNVFGLSIKYEKWDKKDYLPFYIVNSYEFYNTYIGNAYCIMLEPIDELATIPSLKKQIEKIQSIDNVPVVLKLVAISNFRRESFIENNIAFITDKQVFLPFIGAMLANEQKVQKPIEKFYYSSQQLLLFYIYNNKKRLYVSEAGKVLPFSAMTLTRAVRQLEVTNLFIIGKDGVNKYIESKYSNYKLFEKIYGYLLSPVKKVGYIDKIQVTKDMIYAGETALSEKTILNPSKLVTYATYEKGFDKSLLIEEFIDLNKQVRLELWGYNPNLFSNDKFVDVISLILSFKDINDERILQAIDELKERRLNSDG